MTEENALRELRAQIKEISKSDLALAEAIQPLTGDKKKLAAAELNRVRKTVKDRMQDFNTATRKLGEMLSRIARKAPAGKLKRAKELPELSICSTGLRKGPQRSREIPS